MIICFHILGIIMFHLALCYFMIFAWRCLLSKSQQWKEVTAKERNWSLISVASPLSWRKLDLRLEFLMTLDSDYMPHIKHIWTASRMPLCWLKEFVDTRFTKTIFDRFICIWKCFSSLFVSRFCTYFVFQCFKLVFVLKNRDQSLSRVVCESRSWKMHF